MQEKRQIYVLNYKCVICLEWDRWATHASTVMTLPVLHKLRNFLPPNIYIYLFIYIYIYKPRVCSMQLPEARISQSVRTRLRAWSGVRIPVGARYVSLFQNIQTGSGGLHSLLFNGYSDSFYCGNNNFILRVTVACFSHTLKGIQIINSTLCSISLTWMQTNYVRSSRKMTYFIVVH